MPRKQQLTKSPVALAAAIAIFSSTYAQAEVAGSPLFLTQGLPPNIMLLLDNSGTMVEDLTGVTAAECEPPAGADCLVGANAPSSKAEIIRRVARQLIEDYEGQVNLGLMAYQQYPYSSNYGDMFSASDPKVSRGFIGTRFYDVSYNPDDYDENFSGDPWDSATKRFSVTNVSDPANSLSYNVGIPGFQNFTASYFCHTRDPDNEEHFRFRCHGDKSGTSNANEGYSNELFSATFSLGDSARARGVTHYGARMALLNFEKEEYTALNSPGLGFLHVPIDLLEGGHQTWLETKVGPQDHSDPDAGVDRMTDSSRSIVAAGLTPLEGSMYTARDYFNGDSDHFGADQGSGNALAAGLPQICSPEDAAMIWLTDGMPSVDRNGNSLGDDVESALAGAVAAVEEFYSATKAKAYVMGFALPAGVPDDALNQLASAGGTGNAFMANDESALSAAMNNIFSRIVEESRLNASTVATTSSRLDTETASFQAIFESGGWTGDLESYNLADRTQRWSVNEELVALTNPRNQRVIFTAHNGAEVELRNLSAAARDGLNYTPGGVFDGLADDRINWLYGQRPFHADLRSRTNADGSLRLLGDIVNSNPLYVGHRNYGYRLLGDQEGADYGTFRASSEYRSRPAMVYVGANDGMLHAFTADTGEERFGFMPSELLFAGEDEPARITNLMDADFSHQYFVDGSPAVGDAYIDGDWRTVLVGTMGAGGRTVFALDITNPDEFDNPADMLLWEFTHDELGLGVGHPEIVRLPSGEWAAVFGNGYDGASDESGLFVVSLEDAANHVWISSGRGNTGRPNAMGPAATTDLAGSNPLVTQRAYAGDLHGNLWWVDFDDRAIANVDDHWTLQKLFETADDQPITAKPVGQPNPDGEGFVVAFGTGSFYLTGDRAKDSVQALYGIVHTGNNEVARNDLLEQSIIWQDEITIEQADGTDIGRWLRATSDHSPDDSFSDHVGWVLELVYEGNTLGERVISRGQLVSTPGRDAVRFTTLIPDEDPCGVGRTGFLMELNLVSGARPDNPVFDTDGDGMFDESDMVEVDGEMVAVSGVGGVTQGEELSTVQDAEGTEQIVQPVQEGDDESTAPGLLGDSRVSGRISWEQLR